MPEVLDLLAGAFASAFDWFGELMNSTLMLPIFVTMFSIFMIVRFLLAPFLGAAMRSGVIDSVKKGKGKKGGK